MPRGRDSTKMPCFWHEEAVFSGAFQFEFLLVFHEHGAGLFPQCFHMAGSCWLRWSASEHPVKALHGFQVSLLMLSLPQSFSIHPERMGPVNRIQVK